MTDKMAHNWQTTHLLDTVGVSCHDMVIDGHIYRLAKK
jgi:hypothetical protein